MNKNIIANIIQYKRDFNIDLFHRKYMISIWLLSRVYVLQKTFYFNPITTKISVSGTVALKS